MSQTEDYNSLIYSTVTVSVENGLFYLVHTLELIIIILKLDANISSEHCQDVTLAGSVLARICQ